MNWVLSAFADEIDADLGVQFFHLVQHGIRLVDLRSAFGKNVMQLTDAEVRQVRELAREQGLRFNCVASPINKVVVGIGTAEEELEKLERAIEIGRILGTNRIRIFTPEGGDWETTKAWMTPHIRLAERKQVVLMHENDGKYYGSVPIQARQLFKEFGSANFRAAFDFANSAQHGFYAMDDWFPWLLPYLETIHMKDAREDGKVVPVGEGVGQVPQTLKWLKDQGWNGVLSIEPHLQYAGERHGFSGIESFGIATQAVKEMVKSV